MTVGIVTDSATALPPALAERHRITVVPMWLQVGGERVREGERTLEELVAATGVTTSGPSPGEFIEAIERRRSSDGVLVVTIASSMSSTHQAAVIAAGSLDVPVRVVDSTTAAGAEALVVLAAAEAAERGLALTQVAAAAERAREAVRLVATIPSLEHLARSGRVPGIAGWAGDRLGINPLFEFRRGEVHRLRPAMSRQAALDRIVSLCRRGASPGHRLHVAALHALAPDDGHRLLEQVRDLQPATSFVSEFGSVMVVHTGPGLAGLAWWWEPA
ncbi:DegV family protein [Rhabdothermincola sp.]|uniref:DegV family protein n=1 Tax=Rhabdothermincola sp. TaxID=2820405 RepID=UPI002FE14EDF